MYVTKSVKLKLVVVRIFQQAFKQSLRPFVRGNGKLRPEGKSRNIAHFHSFYNFHLTLTWFKNYIQITVKKITDKSPD